jgi:hypothetical protein
VDLLFGGRRKRIFYKVIRLGERIDLWLNLHGVLSKGDGTGDGLFGASRAGSKTMLGQLEQAVRGGDEPRSRRRRQQLGDFDLDLKETPFSRAFFPGLGSHQYALGHPL